MVIIMDMTSGKSEQVDIDSIEAEPNYGEDVLLSGWTAVPAGMSGERPQVAPRLAEVAAESKTTEGTEEFLSRIYAAQGLPGRR